MPQTESKKASTLEVGDKLHFPNSRMAQEVTMRQLGEEHITVEGTEGVRWVVPLNFDVNVEVPDTTP